MKERPIIFSAPMVRAILAGTKSQTRRVVKPQPPAEARDAGVLHSAAECDGLWWWLDSKDLMDASTVGEDFRCPFGVPGDRLWVSEACRAHELTDEEARKDTYGVIERLGLEAPPYGLDGVIYEADGVFREIRNTREAAEAWGELSFYRKQRCALVPPLHMPRWASRITLEITGVRVERVQEISDAGPANDCTAEGVYHCGLAVPTYEQWHGGGFHSAEKFMYRQLWESLHSAGSWDANPWVWVIEFKRVEQARTAA